MADKLVTLVVAEGNRVVHDGKVLDAGESFEIGEAHAKTLVENGGCEAAADAPKSSRSRGKKAAADAPEDDAPSE